MNAPTLDNSEAGFVGYAGVRSVSDADSRQERFERQNGALVLRRLFGIIYI